MKKALLIVFLCTLSLKGMYRQKSPLKRPAKEKTLVIVNPLAVEIKDFETDDQAAKQDFILIQDSIISLRNRLRDREDPSYSIEKDSRDALLKDKYQKRNALLSPKFSPSAKKLLLLAYKSNFIKGAKDTLSNDQAHFTLNVPPELLIDKNHKRIELLNDLSDLYEWSPNSKKIYEKPLPYLISLANIEEYLDIEKEDTSFHSNISFLDANSLLTNSNLPFLDPHLSLMAAIYNKMENESFSNLETFFINLNPYIQKELAAITLSSYNVINQLLQPYQKKLPSSPLAQSYWPSKKEALHNLWIDHELLGFSSKKFIYANISRAEYLYLEPTEIFINLLIYNEDKPAEKIKFNPELEKKGSSTKVTSSTA